MAKSIASNALTLLIVLIVCAAALVGWARSEYSAVGPLESPICLQVVPGSNMERVSRELEERGAVSSGSLYRIGTEYAGKNALLKAGSFLVPEAASMEEIADIVTRGGQSTCGTEIIYRIGIASARFEVRELDPESSNFVETAKFAPGEDIPAAYTEAREGDARYRVALAEGVTSWQVVDALRQADFLEGEVAEVPAEGALAPDSYEIVAGADRAEILSRMQSAQENILSELWAERDETVPLETPEQAMVLASIIEKETGVSEERKQVASVFTNRLRQGMKLQTDPTVIYGITKGEGVLGRGLRQSELRRETPWNTYVIDGLPPTPIANPGRAAIEAALNPDETPFIFFVADGTGGHAFAVTIQEHNRNVAEWRKIEAERANN